MNQAGRGPAPEWWLGSSIRGRPARAAQYSEKRRRAEDHDRHTLVSTQPCAVHPNLLSYSHTQTHTHSYSNSYLCVCLNTASSSDFDFHTKHSGVYWLSTQILCYVLCALCYLQTMEFYFDIIPALAARLGCELSPQTPLEF